MYMDIMEELNVIALMKSNENKPNLRKYDNGKNFLDLYYSGVEFYQIFYKDKTTGSKCAETINFNIDSDKIDKLKEELNDYSNKLKQEQSKVIDEFKLSESGKQAYLQFNRVGEDLGFCAVSFHRRYIKDEQEEHAQ